MPHHTSVPTNQPRGAEKKNGKLGASEFAQLHQQHLQSGIPSMKQWCDKNFEKMPQSCSNFSLRARKSRASVSKQAISKQQQQHSAHVKDSTTKETTVQPCPVKFVGGKWKPTKKLQQNFFQHPGCGHKEPWPRMEHLLNLLTPRMKVEDLVKTCMSCQSLDTQCTKQSRADISIARTMKANTNTIKLEWPDEEKCVCIREQLDERGIKPAHKKFLDRLGNPWIVLADEPLRVKILDLTGQVDVLTATQRDTIKGGCHPSRDSGIAFPSTQTLSRPGDGAIGVIKWPTGEKKDPENCILLGPSAQTDADVVKLAQEETKHMVNCRSKSKRAGAAGGFAKAGKTPSADDPSSLTKCTHDRATVPPPHHSRSAAVKVVCEQDGETVDFQSVHADILMRRLNKKQKRKEAHASAVCRNVLISEMKARLKALAVVQMMKMATRKQLFGTFLNSINRAKNKGFRDSWLSVDSNLSDLDILLLEHACGTGEMRNHSSAAAHEDVNKSHILESMTLCGKAAANNSQRAESIVNEMMEQASGTLVLPQIGLAIALSPGRDTAHMKLTKTMHAPDLSRDSTNWARAHGP